MAEPRGVRSNNPGNIIKSSIVWEGEKDSLDESVFETFETPQDGINALCKLLLSYQTKHNLRTVRGVITRWSATDQASYVAHIATSLGVGADDPIDLTDEPTLIVITTEIIRVENGQQPYPPEMIATAARRALGLPDPVAPTLPTFNMDTVIQPPQSLIDAQRRTPPPAPQPQQEQPVMPEILNTIAGVATAFNPVIGLGLGLVNTLIDAFTPLAKQKAQAALNKHGVDPQVSSQLVDSMLGIVKQVTGQAEPIAAVVAAKGSPTMMAQIEQQTMVKLDELAPLLDKVAQYQQQEWDASESSMDSAAARARVDSSSWDMGKTLVYGALTLYGVLLFFVFFVASWQVATKGAPTTEVWAAITGLIGTASGIIGTIVAFRFGASRSSGAKDELVAQMATRRPR